MLLVSKWLDRWLRSAMDEPGQEVRSEDEQADEDGRHRGGEDSRRAYVFAHFGKRVNLRSGEVYHGFERGVEKLGCPHQSHRQDKDRPFYPVQSQPYAERDDAYGRRRVNPGIGLRAEHVPHSAESKAKALDAGGARTAGNR